MANTNTIEFSEYFNNLALSDESKKFVILLGSGFHNNNGSLKSIINDWDLLLKSLDPNFEKSGNYLLDFEKILSEQESNDSAQKTEYSLLKCISNNIKKKQIEILKNLLCLYFSE